VSASALLGLAIMIGSEAATIARIEPFYSWNTPICWTGFILFADAIVWRARGNSWLRSAPREFAAIALLSIPLWVLFEGYNQILDNWYYTGLPQNVLLRFLGYGWSFATIWPAIFEGAELVSVSTSGGSGGSGWVRSARGPREHSESAPAASVDVRRSATASGGRVPASSDERWSGASTLSVVAGALMLVCPFFVSPAIARYLAAPVWLGFIFLLDPISARLGGESLVVDFRNGRSERLKNLLLSGFLCGVLWEFWNYWSGAKWHYSVPIMEHVKIFEMPLPGYLGFGAFAVECFTMYVFVRAVWVRLVRLKPDPAASASRPTASSSSGRIDGRWIAL
jgi:hypothetical protein